MMEIIIIVIGSNHRKDKKAGGVTQGRHLSDMGATFTLHCYFYPLQVCEFQNHQLPQPYRTQIVLVPFQFGETASSPLQP